MHSVDVLWRGPHTQRVDSLRWVSTYRARVDALCSHPYCLESMLSDGFFEDLRKEPVVSDHSERDIYLAIGKWMLNESPYRRLRIWIQQA